MNLPWVFKNCAPFTDPPRATRIIVSPLTELKEGKSVSIFCLSDSFPVGHMVLSRVMDGVQTELMTNDGLETLFTIPSVELFDSGIYFCETSNMYGSHNNSVEITVKGKLLITSGQNQSVATVSTCCSV